MASTWMDWLVELVKVWKKKNENKPQPPTVPTIPLPVPTPPKPVPPPVVSTTPPPSIPPQPSQFYWETLLKLHNEARAREGLTALIINDRLQRAAYEHCLWMANNNKLDHYQNGVGPGTRVTQVNYNWSNVGENIAFGQTTEAAVVYDWLKSPPHRHNIMSGYFTEVGFGRVKASNGRYYWTVVFARPKAMFGRAVDDAQTESVPEGLVADDAIDLFN